MIFQVGAPCVKAHPVEELDIEDTRLGFKNKMHEASVRKYFFDGERIFVMALGLLGNFGVFPTCWTVRTCFQTDQLRALPLLHRSERLVLSSSPRLWRGRVPKFKGWTGIRF